MGLDKQKTEGEAGRGISSFLLSFGIWSWERPRLSETLGPPLCFRFSVSDLVKVFPVLDLP